MANDAYELQGLNGFDKVANGQDFIAAKGHTRGFQVKVSGTFEYTALSPKNQAITFTGVALDPPSFIGGPIYALSVSGGGEAAVFPTTADYTIS